MPTPQDLQISVPLTQFMIDYAEEPNAFASSLILPPMPSSAVSEIFYKADKGKLRQAQGLKRGAGNPPAMTDGQISQVTTTSEERVVRSRIDVEERRNWAAGSMGPDQFHMNIVTQNLLNNKEIELATVLTDPTSWPAANVTTPANLWDTATGNPADDIVAQLSTVRKGVQRNANWFFISDDAWRETQRNANVIEQVKHTSASSVTTEAFAALIGVDNVFVMSATQNTANEGQPDVVDFIWTKDAFLLYSVTNPRGALSFFGLTREFEAMRGFNEPKTDSLFDDVTGSWHYDQLITDFGAGVFFDGVIS